jgi:hypothetical protein
MPIERSRWSQQVIVLLMLGIWDRYVRPAAVASSVESELPAFQTSAGR